MTGYSSSAASLLALERCACGRWYADASPAAGRSGDRARRIGGFREHAHPERRSIPATDVGKLTAARSTSTLSADGQSLAARTNSPGTTVRNRALQMAICTQARGADAATTRPVLAPTRPLRLALPGRTRRPPDPGAGWSTRTRWCPMSTRHARRCAQRRPDGDETTGQARQTHKCERSWPATRRDPVDPTATAPHLVDKPRGDLADPRQNGQHTAAATTLRSCSGPASPAARSSDSRGRALLSNGRLQARVCSRLAAVRRSPSRAD
jgi:hypothetical protein